MKLTFCKHQIKFLQNLFIDTMVLYLSSYHQNERSPVNNSALDNKCHVDLNKCENIRESTTKVENFNLRFNTYFGKKKNEDFKYV